MEHERHRFRQAGTVEHLTIWRDLRKLVIIEYIPPYIKKGKPKFPIIESYEKRKNFM